MRIFVALCTYNGERFLPEQLASLADQTRRPDEVVVCDDRSSDGTVALLRRFAEEAPFPVRIEVNPENLRSTKNFEKAIGQCQGDVIALCDQDDRWLPEKLARMEAAFADPNVGLVACDAWLVGPNLERTGKRVWENLPFPSAMQRQFDAGDGPKLMLRQNLVTGAACAFRASLRDVILPIPTSWVHDGWIAYLAAATSDVRAIGEPLIEYRRHANQQIGVADLTWRRQLRTAWSLLDEAYFVRLAEGFETLTERLERFRDRLRDPAIPTWTAEKARQARTQERMRRTNRLVRFGLALRELCTGRYGRLHHGWKSFAVDVLLK